MGKPRYRICVEEGCRKPRARKSLCTEHFEKRHAKAATEAPAA